MLVLGIFSLMTAVALPNVHISPILLTRVASIVLLYSAALSFNALDIQAIGSGVSIYSGLFQVTSVSQAMDTFIFLVGAMILIPWAPVTKSFVSHSRTLLTSVPTIAEYPLIILFTTCGASFLVSSADLVSIYLSIELQSFAVYILAALYRESESATSAGLKYFLLGGLSSGLILLGSALIYAFTGLTNLESIYSILSVGTVDSLTSGLGPCAIGFTILAVGFLFKVAAAPFHNWAPDVYDGVPTIVTTWLTIMPKISIFVLLLELQNGLGLTGASLTLMFNDIPFDVWKNLLLVSSLMSLIIGTVVGLAQYRIKRLFAYSTISHVGFLLLALAVNSEESIESFLFYIVQYSITNLNAFLVILAFGYVLHSSVGRSDGNGTDIQFISDMAGQFRANPLLGLALTVCLFSMAGVPPLIGFFGKQMILYSATHSGYYFLSIVAIIVSVISASYYLKIVRVIHFDSGEADSNTSTLPQESKLTNVHSFAIATLTMVITLFVFKPSIILNSTSLLALTLFQY
uniref:NADH-ubiquinone oxidoreductase chain 2 n=1 Tax=Tremella fuciformis TaxID=64657 RepID=A0A2H4QBQ9_9TREE|nr:NADH dehydrogenase subunit 2 [Tremella fuciformis]